MQIMHRLDLSTGYPAIRTIYACFLTEIYPHVLQYASEHGMGLLLGLLLGILVIVGLALREALAFARARETYPLRRLTLRMSSALLLLFQLCGILVGVRVFHLDHPAGNASLWLVFWGCNILLICAVLCLVIAYFRTVDSETQEESKRLWREIAEMIAEHERQRTEK